MTTDVRIHRWSAPGIGSVNPYWLETMTAVIVIDGQRELSKARAARAEIDATGKPIAAVFLTHPHPDRFGGIGVFTAPGTPLYGTQQTLDSIAQDRLGLVRQSRDAVQDDFPRHVTVPDQILDDGADLTIAGLRIIAYEWGAGEAECMTILHLPGHDVLFCADIVQDHMTPFLLEGGSAAWLDQLERMRVAFPGIQQLYPGHGAPGVPETLIAQQVEYLTTFRHLIARELDDATTPSGAERVAEAMRGRFGSAHPVAAIPDLLVSNVGAVARELAAEQ